MRKIPLVSVLFLTAALNLIADPSDYGRDYSMKDGDSSSAPIWFIALIIIVGYIAYNIFKKDDNSKSGSGCLAAIIGVIIVFALIYIVNH